MYSNGQNIQNVQLEKFSLFTGYLLKMTLIGFTCSVKPDFFIFRFTGFFFVQETAHKKGEIKNKITKIHKRK